jgi:hypothetical protein
MLPRTSPVAGRMAGLMCPSAVCRAETFRGALSDRGTGVADDYPPPERSGLRPWPQWRLSRGRHYGEQLVSDHSCRRGGVNGERAMPEHLRLEHGPAIADLAPARLAPA